MPPPNSVATDATDAYSFPEYLDSVTTSLVEAKPYYPSYVSSAICEDSPLAGLNEPGYDLLSASRVGPLNGSSVDDYTRSLSGLDYSTQWGGFWNGLTDLESGRQTGFDGSFCSKESNVTSSSIYKDYVKQGAATSKDLSACVEASAVSHSIIVPGRESCIGFSSTKPLDDNFLPQNFKSISDESLRTSVGGSSSVLPETHPNSPFLESLTHSWNFQKANSASYEKCFRQHDTCLNDCKSAPKSPPAIVIRPPPVGANSSASSTVPFINLNSIGSDSARRSEDFADNIHCNLKEPRPPLSSERKEVCLDMSPNILGRRDYNNVDTFATKKEEFSNNISVTKDSFDHFFEKRCELQVPHMSNENGYSLAHDAEPVNFIENSSKSFDQYNPAVDSPCWKGATANRSSPLSEAVTPQLFMRKLETCNSLNLQGPQIFPLNTNDAVRVFSPKPSENLWYHENVCGGNDSSLSAKSPLVAGFSSTGHGPDDAVKPGSCSTKSSCAYGVQFSDYILKSRKEDALPDNLKDDADFRMHASGTYVDDASEDGLSHVPFHVTKHVLSSPPSGEDAPSAIAKSCEENSSPKIDVQMLVKTMHNLSELFLLHCSNDACTLKEQDNHTLQDVIKNLNVCISKTAEQMISTREPLFPYQDTSQFIEKSSYLHKGASVDRSQLTKGASVDRSQVTKVASAIIGQLDQQHIHEEKGDDIVWGVKDEKFQNFASAQDDAEIVKNDKMTQAIKKILVENFHGEEETEPQVLLYKNLWLEAEAVICSTNYRARFDRMKIEMEKCNSHEAKDVSESSTNRISPDVNAINQLAPEPNGGIQDYPIINTSSHEVDVLARFHILKSRDNDSNSVNNLDAEKPSSSKFSPELDKVDKLVPQPQDIPTPEISVHDSRILSKTSHVDNVEDSVMDRLRILKCRVDNLTPTVNVEDPEVPDVNPGCDESWDENFEAIMGHVIEHEKLKVKESSRLCDDRMIHSCWTDKLGNQLPAGWCDSSSSSDWEHVLRDELPAQN